MITLILLIVILYLILHKEMPLKDKPKKHLGFKFLQMFGLVLGHTLKFIGYVLTTIFDSINNILKKEK